MKNFFLFLCLGGALFAEDTYFINLKTKIYDSNILFDYNNVFDKLNNRCQEYNRNLPKIKEKLNAIEKKLDAIKNEIDENNKKIDSLQEIKRGEFEERDDFSRREQEAEKTINSLKERNVSLYHEREKIIKSNSGTESTFKFDDCISGKIELDKNNCSIGYFDIDQKCFECKINNKVFMSMEDKDTENGYVWYQIKIATDSDSFKLFFKSAQNARTFKENYFNGEKFSIPCSIKISALRTTESRKDAEEQTEIDGGAVASNVAKGVLSLGVGLLVECIKPGSGSEAANRLYEGFGGSESTSRTTVPAVYNNYNCFYLKLDVEFKDKIIFGN